MLQFSPVDIPLVEAPKVRYKDLLLENRPVLTRLGTNVVGTKVVHTSKVHFAGQSPTLNDFQYNKENKGYLLVINCRQHFNFINDWSLSAYSNAGAIVLEIEAGRAFSSHLNGFWRETGIPIIAVSYSDLGSFEQRLKDAGENVMCLVYVDEFADKGLIALEKNDDAAKKKSIFSWFSR